MKKIVILIFLVGSISSMVGQTYQADPTFNQDGAGVPGSVNAMAVQPDGKIIIVGSFSTYNGISRNRIARLNPDGSLDTTFDVGGGPVNSDSSYANLFAVAVDSNGKILVGGHFSSFSGMGKRYIVRLNDDGSIDTTFNTGNLIPVVANSTTTVRAIALNPQGKILIGGGFTITGQSPSAIYAFARLNETGSFDTTFTYGNFLFDQFSNVTAIALQPDEKIIVGGAFKLVYGIARFNSSGSVDTLFQSSLTTQVAYAVCPTSDGKVLMGGLFNFQNSMSVPRTLAQLENDGSQSPLFTIFEADFLSSTSNVISAIKMFEDKILIGGHFTSYGGVAYNELVRLNLDGTIDNSFDIGTGANSKINAIAIDQNNKILIVGQFSTFNGVTKPGIARLTDDALSTTETSFPQELLFFHNGSTYHVKSLRRNIESVEVFDSLGKRLHKSTSIGNLDFVFEAIFPRGIFFIQVILDGGQFKFFKTVN
jgi:uncharacterized delta-60 repeat protein